MRSSAGRLVLAALMAASCKPSSDATGPFAAPPPTDSSGNTTPGPNDAAGRDPAPGPSPQTSAPVATPVPAADIGRFRVRWRTIAPAPPAPHERNPAVGLSVGKNLLAHHRTTGWVASYDPCTRKWRAHEPLRREMTRADVLVVDDTHVAFCCGPPDRSGLMYDVGRTKPSTIAPFPNTPNPGRRRRALDHGFLTPTDKRYDSRTGRWTIIPFDDAIREAVGRQDSAVGNGAQWVLTWGGRGTDPSTGKAQLYPGGALFDGSSNTWRLVSTTGSPGPGFGGVTVWTGSEMFVYGGQGQLADGRVVPRNDGGRYDPSADRWTAVAPGPVFEGPIAGTVAGRTVLVWDAVRGGAFDLDEGRWREFGLPAKVPVQSRPFGHGRLAVVTRTDAFVLDPETLRWGRSTLPSTLRDRGQRVEVMTSSHLVVWGGERIVSTGGCEDAPPDVGCDPFTETKVAFDGAALAVGSCR